MIDIIENGRNEFKIKLTGKFEEEVIAFLNTNGGIQDNITKEEFLEGFSLPKNKELMKVFNDLDLVEQMGTGIIRILQSYDKEAFEFFPNFIRVTFPFNENKFKPKKKKNNNLSEIQNHIISLMLDSPTITQETLARLLDVNIRTNLKK